jgi:hypothetical protein
MIVGISACFLVKFSCDVIIIVRIYNFSKQNQRAARNKPENVRNGNFKIGEKSVGNQK